MAQLRLIALAAVAACNASEAGPPSGLTPPAGWRPLPSLAAAASDAAKAAGTDLDGAEAWGEPARGCYAAWLALRTTAGAPQLVADGMLANIAIDLPGVTVSDVVKPAAGADTGVVSLAFNRAPYQGRVRGNLTRAGSHSLLACFWNQREPIACEAACAALIGGMK